MISVDSPIIGPSTGTLDEALSWVGYPPDEVGEYATELWRLCGLVGFNPAILFGQAAHETGDFSSHWWQARHNPAGIGITGDSAQNAASQDFGNGTGAARGHVAHMIAYTYRHLPWPDGAGGQGPNWTGDNGRIETYLGTPPLYHADQRFYEVVRLAWAGHIGNVKQLTGTWATDPKYAQQIAAKANAIFTGGTPVPTVYPVVGLPGPGIALPVPLAHDIIPASQTNQRPGGARQLPGFLVLHETDNHAPGADAEMHNQYLHNGAERRIAGWHFTVDDGVIYQHLPIDEHGWHAADNLGPGNMSGIAAEVCVNAGIDTAKARHNAEALFAGLAAALHMSVDQVKAHYDFNANDPNRHHCPDTMLNEGYWPNIFKSNVSKILDSSTVQYAEPAPFNTSGELGPFDLNGTPALAFQLAATVTAKAGVIPRAHTGPKAPATGPKLATGATVMLQGSYLHGSPRKRGIVVLKDGSRAYKTSFDLDGTKNQIPLPG